MSGENQDVRIKMEPVVANDDEDTQHLYDNDSSEDVKPVITSMMAAFPSGVSIELSSDDDTPARSARVKRKRSSFFIRLVVKEVATQTDGAMEKKDAEVNTDTVSKAELGVNTDEPPKTAEMGVSTDAGTAGDNDRGENEEMDVDEEPHQAPSSSKDIYHQCSICSSYYLSFNLFKKHSQAQHNKVVIEQRKVSYDSKCKFCSTDYVFATYNKHIKTKHTDKFTMNGNIKKKLIGPYECTICNIKFLSYNEGKRHRRVHEHVEKKFVLRKLKTSNENAKAEKKVHTPHAHKSPIPKNVLFQCPKCELNFFTYRNGLRHRVACEKGDKKGLEAKCTKCERKFLQVHIRNHNLQHDLGDFFRVCIVEDGMEHRILYRCMKCKVCMEERGCRLHFQNGCERTVGVQCGVCQVRVDEKVASKHQQAHAQMGLLKDNVILVDICDF